MNELDLYAKIEPLIGFYEEYQELYKIYFHELKKLNTRKLLDVGCGNGMFLESLKGFDVKGIDISEEMVKISKSKGLNVEHKELSEVSEKFDVITAIADVLNYMSKKDLKKFFIDVKNHLYKGGYFLFDINTLYGFSEVAEGSITHEDESGFLSIDAEFDRNKLYTNFVYFEKNGECYKKFDWSITQYYHEERDLNSILKNIDLKLIKKIDINLFSQTVADKKIFIIQKE